MSFQNRLDRSADKVESSETGRSGVQISGGPFFSSGKSNKSIDRSMPLSDPEEEEMNKMSVNNSRIW